MDQNSMDQNLKTPILDFIMSSTAKIKRGFSNVASSFDIENPPPTSPSAAAEPHFELKEKMPHLKNPKLVAAMREAVADVAQTRSVLQTLGARPDHETVDRARLKLAEAEAELSRGLEEVSLSERPDDVDERRKAAEKEIEIYKAVITVDEMHEAYEKLLYEVEKRLEKIYAAAVAGGDDSEALKKDDKGKGLAVEEDVDMNEEVVEILKQFELGKRIEDVNLSGRKLRLFPEAFGKIRSLVVLNLADNQLKEIPDSIAGLENLEELNLSTNLLESLPDSVGLLFNLKVLDVSGNKLTALPDSISHCRSLVVLDASFNKLTYLPTNIGYELVNLKKLSVPLNKIRSLPTSIGEMKSLQFLDVHFNELHGLPASIGRLTSLETLNLSGNFSDLSELPDTIGDLKNLKELDLSNNQIHALPDTFGQLNLEKLSVDQNPLEIPPKEVVSQGVQAIKVHMVRRWVDKLEEERKSVPQVQQTQTSLLTRSTSWLSNVVSNVSEYLGGGGKSDADPYLNQQL